MALTRSKNQSPFEAGQVVVAVRTFAWEGGTVRQGEKFRGGDQVVEANWTAHQPAGIRGGEVARQSSSRPRQRCIPR